MHTTRSTRTPDTQPPSSRTRAVAVGTLLGTLAVSGAALAVVPSHDGPPADVVSTAAAAPSPLALGRSEAALERSRASRTRALPAKAAPALPTKLVTRTVATGASFSGAASWYGGSFNGRRTASGERFDTSELTAASRTLPFGTRLRVCRGERCVVVRVNDRGPYVGGRVLDLSRAAAQALGYSGVAHVTATPVGQRTFAVVDEQAVARLHAAAQRRHAAARHRAVHLAAVRKARAAEAARLQAVEAAQEEGAVGTLPLAALAGGLLVTAGGGLWRARARS